MQTATIPPVRPTPASKNTAGGVVMAPATKPITAPPTSY